MRNKLYFLSVLLLAFLLLGFVVTQREINSPPLQKVDHCRAINIDGKVKNLVAAKPCTPSGWWCTSNSQCCSGRCTNNICD